MNRKEITLFLSHTLERTKLNVFGKHYAKEVTRGHPRQNVWIICSFHPEIKCLYPGWKKEYLLVTKLAFIACERR